MAMLPGYYEPQLGMSVSFAGGQPSGHGHALHAVQHAHPQQPGAPGMDPYAMGMHAGAANAHLMHAGAGMPPAGAGLGHGIDAAGRPTYDHKEPERLLPIANISRIMKKALPDSAKMSKEAKAAIQECVSEFIGFVTSEASDRLTEDKRRTITGDDVIDSMRALGFDAYTPCLEDFLGRYRGVMKHTKNGPVGGKRAASAHMDDLPELDPKRREVDD